MAVLHGKNGSMKIGVAASEVEETPVTNWTMTLTAENEEYVSNASSGWRQRVAGFKDATGSYDIVDLPTAVGKDGGAPGAELTVGADVGLVLYTNQDIWTFSSVLIESIEVNNPLDGIVSFTVNWVNNTAGGPTQSTGSAP
jgi:hypothetical protein